MGLDMYLERFPLIKGTVKNIPTTLKPIHFSAVQAWFNYLNYLSKPLHEDETEKTTWENWANEKIINNLPDMETITKLASYNITRYSAWDTEKKYGYSSITEEVGYWRKANQIHNWFVENIQDGEDDCCYHREVTRSDLEDLRNTCIHVLKTLKMKTGKIKNGYTLDKDGQMKYNYEQGKIATNTATAEELLPTSSGFFFGSTDYDEYYESDLYNTIEIIDKVLATTDFNNQSIYYCSSW